MPRIELRDHYSVLGVSYKATGDQIKKAYRARAKELHPDKLGPEATAIELSEAEELFKEAAAAYEVLSNAEKRGELDSWLDSERASAFDFGGFTWGEPSRPRAYQPPEPPSVPQPDRFEHDGVWVYVIYGLNYWSDTVTATVQVSISDVFQLVIEPSLPHEATIAQYEVVDAKGDVVGRGHSLQSMRDRYRRYRAEENRNRDRRSWKERLANLRDHRDDLASEGKPVDTLSRLIRLAEAKEARAFQWEYSDNVKIVSMRGPTRKRLIDPRGYRHGYSRDTVIKAIREAEKELERLQSHDLADVLLADILEGKITHPDVEFNNQIVAENANLALRSGEEVPAFTEEAVREHYLSKLQGISSERDLLFVNLRLTDDREIIQEMIDQGLIELAPEKIKLLGAKNRVNDYPVNYRFEEVDGKRVPVGVVTVPFSVYQKHGYSSGVKSTFPTLPHEIILLVRVRLARGSKEVVTDPHPDGKLLRREVERRLSRL